MRSLWVLSLLLLLSCYNPSIQPGHFKCDRPGDTCPAGLLCIGGYCTNADGADLAAGGQGDLSRGGSGDLATGNTTDLSMNEGDLASGDLASGPCTNGGQMVAPSVYACTGNFTAGNYAALCNADAGYRVCDGTRDGTLLGRVMNSTCNGIGGFYAILMSASISPNRKDISCPSSGTQVKVLAGCGSETGTIALDNNCKMLKAAFPCDVVQEWSCTTGLADAAHNNAGGLGGILCCM